eukprot:sb/3475378/
MNRGVSGPGTGGPGAGPGPVGGLFLGEDSIHRMSSYNRNNSLNPFVAQGSHLDEVYENAEAAAGPSSGHRNRQFQGGDESETTATTTTETDTYTTTETSTDYTTSSSNNMDSIPLSTTNSQSNLNKF